MSYDQIPSVDGCRFLRKEHPDLESDTLEMTEERVMKWFNLAVKAVVEPLIGKIKDDDVALKKEVLNLSEKISPDNILVIKRSIDSMFIQT
ncbi:hypothetical protein C1645_824428 [Glomus cerebriforme]|uniref:Uncharacterized protein n=1 Tax=Glomus cerebriforme TaxID=658196 RepID=A0A397T3T4_9GLOM|nr:hypothetical protein C1645_824428 [Glomus cerebriforme]